MKPVSAWILPTIAFVAWSGAAWGESLPLTGTAPATPPVAVPHRIASFAPVAAAHARLTTPAQREERRFLKDAAAASRFESDAARLALARSSNPAVRSFAASLVNHHTLAANDLQHMLHARAMAPPMLGNDQRKTLNRLAKLQGARFDREYLVQAGLRYQQEDVQCFERARLAAGEPTLRSWIDRNLETLRYHLAMAERLAPAGLRYAKVPARAPENDRMAAHGGPATRAMGAGPMPAPASGAGEFLQLGGTGAMSPFAARPIELNIR